MEAKKEEHKHLRRESKEIFRCREEFPKVAALFVFSRRGKGKIKSTGGKIDGDGAV